jgi:hypothetical protein
VGAAGSESSHRPCSSSSGPSSSCSSSGPRSSASESPLHGRAGRREGERMIGDETILLVCIRSRHIVCQPSRPVLDPPPPGPPRLARPLGRDPQLPSRRFMVVRVRRLTWSARLRSRQERRRANDRGRDDPVGLHSVATHRLSGVRRYATYAGRTRLHYEQVSKPMPGCAGRSLATLTPRISLFAKGVGSTRQQ